MKMVNEYFETLGMVIADDQNGLGEPSDAPSVNFIGAEFTESPSLGLADLTFASIGGTANAVAGVVGTQLESIDPITGDVLVTLNPPAGGWRKETTGADTFPKTIYGYAIMAVANGVLVAVHQYPEPIVLTGINQAVEVPSATIRIPRSSL